MQRSCDERRLRAEVLQGRVEECPARGCGCLRVCFAMRVGEKTMAVFGLLVSFVGLVAGHERYRLELPNAAVGPIEGSVAIGHKLDSGSGQINRFGMDFAAEGYAWTRTLCALDSDGDGQSNGFELGDPSCTWAVGRVPQFTADISHPGLITSMSRRNETGFEDPVTIAHLPIIPHSGWISLSIVLAPLVLAAIFGCVLTNTIAVNHSRYGRVLLHEKYSSWCCLIKDTRSIKDKVANPNDARARWAQHELQMKQRCCNRYCYEVDAFPWFLDLRVGEALFLAAVVAGLLALVALKQGLKHNLANTLGQLASTLCFLVTLPVTRTSLWVFVFGIPFERAVRWHRAFGKMFVVAVYLHLLVVLWRYGSVVLTANIQWGPSKDAPYPVYGFIGGIGITLIGLTSVERVRRQSYNFFYLAHLPLLVLISVMAILHAPGSEYRGPVCLAFGLWVLDRTFGRLLLRSHVCANAKLDATTHQNVVVLTVRLKKALKMAPGAYFNVIIPEVDRLVSHPFSVSLYNREENEMSFHMKTWGKEHSFVQRLQNLGLQQSNTPELHPVLEGPYGNLSIDLSQYKTFWLCSGGIGVTPMMNVAQYLNEQNEIDGLEVHFVWSVKKQEDFNLFSRELSGFSKSNRVHLHLFVTAETDVIHDEVKSGDRAPLSANQVSPGMSPEILPGKHSSLSQYIHFQRADFASLFCAKFESVVKPAVLTCGPKSMVAAVQYHATALGWAVHEETFLY